MRIVSLLFLNAVLFLLVGCSYLPTFSSKEPPAPLLMADSAEITSIIQDFTVNFKHDRHLHLEKAKTYYEDGITAVQLQFISQDLIEMCEARELIVDMVENLLSRMNQDPILGPEIAFFPFTADNLEIYITFESYFGRFVDPYYIAWICLEDGEVAYYTFDLHDNAKKCWHARRESYATSREIVVYQREAEKKYEEEHRPLINIFGNGRYTPSTNE